MTGRTAVDVVMPAHNAETYIGEAISSVLGQTYSDLRLYVVDDGSSDETPEIVASFDDSRVVYIRREHGGPSAARNTGLAASDAPYVAFLDADDRWRAHKLAAQVDMLEREPSVGLVHGFQLTIDARGGPIHERTGGLRGYVFDQLLTGNLVTGSASIVLVRRKAFARLGPFREDLAVAEDWEMWLRIARVFAFDHVPDVLVDVRSHENGLQQDLLLMADGRLRMYDEVVTAISLEGRRRARLARACLIPSIADFAAANRPERALRTFARLVRADPTAVTELRASRFYLWLAVMTVKGRRRHIPR